MAQIDLTPVRVLTLAAGMIFSPEVAQVVGPYVVILLGAIGGAVVAMINAESKQRGRAIMGFVGAVVITLILTVPLSLAFASYWHAVNDQWLFAPVALVLGYCGDKWGRVLKWAGGKVNSFIDILIATRAGKTGEDK